MPRMPANGGARDASPQPASHPKATPVSGWLILFLATACGLIVANLYYSQPLVGPISADLGLSPRAAGVIVTMTQVGYGIGLLLIVPLGDLFENRKLVISVIALGALAMLASAFAATPGLFLAAALFIGIGSVSVQILVPYAAHLASDENRGRVVGNVMSGLMFGIMLSRPVSSFLTELTNWRVIFFVSTGIMVVLMVAVRLVLPVSRPKTKPRYFELLGSMARLMITSRVLRRRGHCPVCPGGCRRGHCRPDWRPYGGPGLDAPGNRHCDGIGAGCPDADPSRHHGQFVFAGCSGGRGGDA